MGASGGGYRCRAAEIHARAQRSSRLRSARPMSSNRPGLEATSPMKRKLSRLIVSLGVVLSCLGAAPSAFGAVGQLDQEQTSAVSGDIGAAQNYPLEQWFTAGRTGALTDVSVYGHLQNT